MAADPVIIDDGGSTRIRYRPLTCVGAMDGLLAPPGMQESRHTFTAKLFTALKIVFIDPDSGTPTTIPVAGSAPLAPGDKIEIVSGPLTVQVDIDSPAGSGNSVITSFGPPEGPPLVDAKNENGKRVYRIAAAPQIDSVTVTRRGEKPITPFDAAKMPSAYTQIHLCTPDPPKATSAT